jgi:hypothetical protein
MLSLHPETLEMPMTFADAVRFWRKCTVNELITLEYLFAQRKLMRAQMRIKAELMRNSRAVHLL